MQKLQTRSPYYNNHHLFQFLNDWFTHQDIDTDVLHETFLSCMSPAIHSKGFYIDSQTADIVRSLLLTLAAFTIPNLKTLLFPIHWCESQNNHTIDMQDHIAHTYLCLSHSPGGKISLRTSSYASANCTQFPIFASARNRKINRNYKLQLLPMLII